MTPRNPQARTARPIVTQKMPSLTLLGSKGCVPDILLTYSCFEDPYLLFSSLVDFFPPAKANQEAAGHIFGDPEVDGSEDDDNFRDGPPV